MVRITVITDNKKTIDEVGKFFHLYDIQIVSNEEEIEEKINTDNSDIILYDCESEHIDIKALVRKFKLILQTKDIRSLLLLSEKDIDYSLIKYTNDFINRPIDESLFAATINSNMQMRDNLRSLSKNNNDLAKSLYQLNVLYTTGTQIAGTLDKTKLIDIMTNGLDQSLSLSLCYALILNNVNDIKLIIKSLFPISQRLEDAIKLRALLNYKNLFSISPNINDIAVSKFTKDQYGEYDLNVFGFDNLFAPININNRFFGVIEVFRETDFAQDDAKCFTTLVKQVSLPLESAILYEEIKTANDKLEKLERLKSEFISIVSHELKTPLTSINSALDIILNGSSGDINDTMKKFLNLAKRNVKRLSAIIGDLLDLSKIEAGKMEFRFEKTNINLPVELVKNTLENLAKERNITININLNKDMESVYIDTQRIEQVLTNLISNAIKFTTENGTIEVTSSKITAEAIKNNEFFTKLPEHLSNEYIQISVKDNGIGIAKENWTKVFEQFKQIENSLSRKVGGSGLGLPISKRLIEAHKGFIWLNSELNKGSTFYIAIPVMNDKEIFELSLEQDMQKAKQEKMNIALFSLKEKIVESKSFIDKIISEEIIRKTNVFKDYSIIKNNERYYYSYAMDIDSYVFDFEVKRLETYIKENKQDFLDCDIMYSSVIYPKGGDNIKDLKDKLNKFKKGM